MPDKRRYQYLAKEEGLNRYERITRFDFSAGDDYWSKTGNYWKLVRHEWAELTKGDKPLVLAKEIDHTPLFMALFEVANAYTNPKSDTDSTRKKIAETIAKYRRS